MNKTAITILGIAMMAAGAASAADEQARDRIQHELTASISAAGAQAMQEMRQTLEAELPHDVRQALAEELMRGLSLKQQVEQLRAAYGARQSTDRI